MVAFEHRCVKTEYVVNSGTYDKIWDDSGSGADRDVSLWANTAMRNAGIDATIFTAIANHSRPYGRPIHK